MGEKFSGKDKAPLMSVHNLPYRIVGLYIVIICNYIVKTSILRRALHIT